MLTGKELRDAGITSVEKNTPQWWKDACDRAIHTLAARGVEFTAEEVRSIVGDPPNHPNAMGARFISARRQGVITLVGYKTSIRASRHANVLKIWRGV